MYTILTNSNLQRKKNLVHKDNEKSGYGSFD
jgi:hypothetical protein